MAIFQELAPELGFDAGVSPAWFMVPLGGANTCKLVGGAGMTVTSVDTTVAKVVELPGTQSLPIRLLIVQGVKKGSTFLEAKRGSTLVERLEVSVKAKKTVRLGFNFVSDTGGHKTRRTKAETAGYVSVMNSIFLPQVNIEIKEHSSRDVRVPQNLRQVVRFSRHLAGVAARQHEWDAVVAMRDSSADFNIFFVWEYEQDMTPHDDHTDAGTLGGNCIFEDQAGAEVGETLAHETGHFLGCADVYAGGLVKNLMYGITDARGRKIPKTDANVMNP